jgi:signal transduction histidine kinase
MRRAVSIWRSSTKGLSIKARLAFVFLMLFMLLIALGLESLRSLSYVNDASAQIRDRWLPSTRALGDLNNFTTDFPAAEAALLRADDADRRTAIKRQMDELDRGIAAAQRAYLQIRHDAAEDALYRRFEAQWRGYRDHVDQIAVHSPSITSMADTSMVAYDAASATLGMLTERNVASAREASESSNITYAQARGRVAFAIFLAGVLVAGAMLHVTRSISAPLVNLAERMHRLAASESGVDVRGVEVQGTQRHDEIGEMARAVVVFRNNAIDLAQNRQALAQQAAMLQDKLAEEQRLTQLQRNFVSMASHEFRTPLAIIDGHAQRLISMRERLTAQELAQRARKVRNTVRRMTQLIDNLIGSARLIDGPIDLNYHPRRVDLALLLREVCQLQQELTPEARILDDVSTLPLCVYGDASLLNQVFGNLLSNAVKYSPEGGAVRVSAALNGAQIVIEIEDRGIGIPESDRHRVFERYYRGSNTSGIVGTGVGLYLVKTIVDLHHGGIALDSHEGEGSRFTVRLPRMDVEPADAPPASSSARSGHLIAST